MSRQRSKDEPTDAAVKLATDKHIVIEDVVGTGKPHGHVTAKDIYAAAKARAEAPPTDEKPQEVPTENSSPEKSKATTLDFLKSVDPEIDLAGMEAIVAVLEAAVTNGVAEKVDCDGLHDLGNRSVRTGRNAFVLFLLPLDESPELTEAIERIDEIAYAREELRRTKSQEVPAKKTTPEESEATEYDEKLRTFLKEQPENLEDTEAVKVFAEKAVKLGLAEQRDVKDAKRITGIHGIRYRLVWFNDRQILFFERTDDEVLIAQLMSLGKTAYTLRKSRQAETRSKRPQDGSAKAKSDDRKSSSKPKAISLLDQVEKARQSSDDASHKKEEQRRRKNEQIETERLNTLAEIRALTNELDIHSVRRGDTGLAVFEVWITSDKIPNFEPIWGLVAYFFEPDKSSLLAAVGMTPEDHGLFMLWLTERRDKGGKTFIGMSWPNGQLHSRIGYLINGAPRDMSILPPRVVEQAEEATAEQLRSLEAEGLVTIPAYGTGSTKPPVGVAVFRLDDSVVEFVGLSEKNLLEHAQPHFGHRLTMTNGELTSEDCSACFGMQLIQRALDHETPAESDPADAPLNEDTPAEAEVEAMEPDAVPEAETEVEAETDTEPTTESETELAAAMERLREAGKDGVGSLASENGARGEPEAIEIGDVYGFTMQDMVDDDIKPLGLDDEGEFFTEPQADAFAEQHEKALTATS